ncbi:MAG: quinolinate synthase NadA [Clostridiales bacterium]|nr:quinolinate synthase NadA [Clostridiales bacterium]
MEIRERIAQLKRERRAILAAHTYQPPAVQELADILGDSFALAREAARSEADTVVVCGVRFMAEGIKILSPEKRVILAAPEADCPMARQIPPEQVAEFRQAHPDTAVVAYINTTAELKAVADVCVTSSSAVQIVRRLPQRDILFIPDRNLGDYVRRQVPEKNILTWDGFCPVHNAVTAADVQAARAAHPGARVAMHPECPPDALALADMVGSTAEIMKYIAESSGEIVVATERGVVDRLAERYPGRLHQLCGDCLTCPDMKLTTPERIVSALEGTGGEAIELPPALMAAARGSLENMLRYGS